MKIAKQEYKVVDINSIHPHEKNVNQGDMGAIHESIDENDFFGALLVNKNTNKIIAGKHRWLAAIQQGAKEIPVILVDDITETKAIKMMLGDNRINRLGMDSGEDLLELLNTMKDNSAIGLKGTGYNLDDMDLLMSDLQSSYQDTANTLKEKNIFEKNKDLNSIDKINNPNKIDRATLRVQEEDDDPGIYLELMNQMQSGIVKNESEFTQSNDWGILDLDINFQLDEIPENSAQLWGSKKTNNKTIYHFFTDDYRYTSLFKNPDDIIKLNPIGIIEPNFGVSALFPKAVALYRVYQKRWIARNCQKYNIKIAVNLDMPAEFMDLNFIGVPKDWYSFAANGNIINIDLLYQYHELAVNYTGNPDIKYFLYGGGRRIGELCKDNGWTWISDTPEPNKKLKK